ncbi:MAG: cupin domain-containing protein [Rhizobiaceae bacterium]
MRINADFSKRVVVKFDKNQWVPSPMAGVERKMLDRIGDEVARATTIVRYAPGSSFSAHTHDGGEEYIVLEGVFQDEHGDFPVGSYVRNPPTSSHTPAAEDGAIIFVKLHQFDPADRTQVHEMIEQDKTDQHLFSDKLEVVRVEHWKPGSTTEIEAPGGIELLVLNGSFSESGDQLEKWDWLRLPPGSRLDAIAGGQGAQVWIKSGHLENILEASS